MTTAMRTAKNDDYFESRIEPKPKQELSQLIHTVESLSQDISEADLEIRKWNRKKYRIKDQVEKLYNRFKGVA